MPTYHGVPARRRTKQLAKRAPKRKGGKYPRYRSLPLGGFADKQTARLKYVEFVTLNNSASSSSVPNVYHYRANSLHDPNYSGGGHQPRGFDELKAIYDHYTVIGSKMKASFENDVDATNQAGQYCFLMLQDTNNTPTSLVDILEESNRNKMAYKPRNTNSSKNIILTKKFSPYKMFGIPKKDSIINNVNLNAQVTQNPSEDAIYTIGIACSRTTSTDPEPVVVRVEIEYIAVFTEKRPMSSS